MTEVSLCCGLRKGYTQQFIMLSLYALSQKLIHLKQTKKA